ncbi:MAG: FAD-binding oxidoreductase [Candidatus Dormibacteraceae bacterium]
MAAVERMDRRRFLLAMAGAAAGGGLVACGGAGSNRQARGPTDADWRRLAGRLDGRLVRPDDPSYGAARQLYDLLFDDVRPEAIALCSKARDVAACIGFAQQHEVPAAVRSGGHSYGGYSTGSGLVIDVTRMATVQVDTAAGTAVVGAGTRLIDLYAQLAQQGVLVPGGSCPTVGIAGLTLGGGFGVLSRKYGLTADNMLSAEVVLADGRLVTCDAKTEPDLFWALRGGGGGNFGVVTSFTFRVHGLPQLALGTLRWPWERAAEVITAWQEWAPQAPDEFWANCVLQSHPDQSPPLLQVGATYTGPVADLQDQLAALSDRVGGSPSLNQASGSGYLDAMLFEAGCGGMTVAQCHLPSENPAGRLSRAGLVAASDYFDRPLPEAGAEALATAVSRRAASPQLGQGGIVVDADGGAMNRVAPDATAYVHRSALGSLQYVGNWQSGDASPTVDANRAWVQESWQAMRAYVDGGAYQNYVDPSLKDWQQAYYGQNLARLRAIKRQYDKGNFFHFAQSIPPA